MVTKTKKNTKKATSPEAPLITADEAWGVIEFARQLYDGYFTPNLINQRMQDVSLNPQKATADKIDEALLNPKNNEQNLIGYSEYMELSSMIYKRVLNYFSGLLAFNFTYTCKNATGKDYKSPAYKKDLKIVEEFFDRFIIKDQFGMAIRQMMRQEAYFAIFREDGNYRSVLQELPQQYCLITGRWDMGLVFDFDMMFFYQAGTDVDMYPPVFKKMYNKVFGIRGTTEYDPANPVERRNDTWVKFVQTSPKDGFWCFKLFPEQTTVIPFLSPYMKDVILQDMIRNLQRDSYIAEASKILVGQVPFLKDTKASVKDSLALSPETLGKFLQLMKAGLPSAVKAVSAPLEDMKGVEFKGSPDIYDSYLKSAASASGINSRLIYSYDRQNLLETKLSMDIDVNILRPILLQFEAFLEYFVNKKTKKFKFKFTVEGYNTSLNRDERLNTTMKLADSGIVMDQKFAGILDMTPFEFRRMMEESKETGFVDKLTPILKANQMSGEAGAKTGAPKKSDSDLSEGGSESREAGSNEEKAES